MNHKHLTDEEILKYMRKKGTIKKIDKKILECNKCFERYKHILYRERFLKEQAKSKRKDNEENKNENI